MAIEIVKNRTLYNYDRDEFSLLSGQENFEESMTQQNFKEECDINTIVRNFGLSAEMPVLDRLPLQERFVEVMDYHSAANELLAARETFMTLPSDLRDRFKNDPGQFVAFCSDVKNLDELRKLGLAKPLPDTTPMRVEVVNPPASPDSTVTT